MLDLSRKKVQDPFRIHKRIPAPQADLILNGQRIESSTTVKFLGLHINRELRWKEQAAAALGKGQDWVGQCGRIARPTGGDPRALHAKVVPVSSKTQDAIWGRYILRPSTTKHLITKQEGSPSSA